MWRIIHDRHGHVEALALSQGMGEAVVLAATDPAWAQAATHSQHRKTYVSLPQALAAHHGG